MTAVQERSAGTLPHWDLTPVYPRLDSPEFESGFGAVVDEIGAMKELFDSHGIGATEDAPATGAAPVFDEVLTRLNALLDSLETLWAYIIGHVTTDSRDAVAQARLSELQRHSATLTTLETRFTAWVGSLEAEELIRSSEPAAAHAFAVRRAKEGAAHLMPQPQEELAAELDLSGATAWSKLHHDLTSQITVSLARGGETDDLPMSKIRALAHDADRDVRRRAYEAELEAWERAAVPLAAAMNSIKGQVNTLSARRGWPSPLDEALWASHIDRATLDAMLGAVREAFPDLRRYLKAKARAIGVPTLAWYDLFAPLGAGASDGGGNGRVWDFETAQSFIVEQFGSYSERLRDFGRRAFEERWIDAEPRAGKTDGAFCMHLRRGESRILANYSVSYGAVSTLAHELGHGYHNLAEGGLTAVQRRTPMTLAETASIFCETIVREAALEQGSPAEQLEILEGSLQDNVQVTLDTLSRFLFESRVFERRRERELSIDELCELMLETQRETYGDGLDQDTLHPYMWAVKPHYYSQHSFYNYPYTFGLLFGLGLYAQYGSDPERFRAGYDELLASTGSSSAAELGDRFGIDVRSSDFWHGSLASVVAGIDRFESLV